MPTTRIQTEAEYIERERRMLDATLERVESAPLAERKEAAREYSETLTASPDIIAQRIGWLFEGCYGKGAHDRVRGWLAYAAESPKRRMNSVKVNCCVLLAALDDGCTARDAVKARKGLTVEQQTKLDELLTAELACVDL
jgi:hypothetical protein